MSSTLMKSGALVAAGWIVPLCLAQESAASQAPLQASPARNVLVVDNNAQEAFVADDVADPTDMHNLVDRMLSLVSHVPDAVVLQEVVRGAHPTWRSSSPRRPACATRSWCLRTILRSSGATKPNR